MCEGEFDPTQVIEEQLKRQDPQFHEAMCRTLEDLAGSSDRDWQIRCLLALCNMARESAILYAIQELRPDLRPLQGEPLPLSYDEQHRILRHKKERLIESRSRTSGGNSAS